jgi:hypothetical protein
VTTTCCEWRDVPGYQGYYKVSRCGQLWSVRRNKVLKLFRSEDGYYHITLVKDGRRKHYLVHRLVASAFIATIPPDHQVNHIDGDKGHNDASNLEIVTAKENHDHAKRLGLIPSSKGEGNCRAKLTEGLVREVLRLLAEGKSIREVAELFPFISARTVYRIAEGSSWSHVRTAEPPGPS